MLTGPNSCALQVLFVVSQHMVSNFLNTKGEAETGGDASRPRRSGQDVHRGCSVPGTGTDRSRDLLYGNVSFFIPGGYKEMFFYLGWPMAPSCMSPNAGWGDVGSCGVSANEYSCKQEPK